MKRGNPKSTENLDNHLAPIADHHQHLFSPIIAAMLSSEANEVQTITARVIIRLLDEAGIGSALLLSVAYMYGSPARIVSDEYAKVTWLLPVV
jgi:hypothetical protein